MHTDCQRDFKLQNHLGFKGKHVELIPGGTGYELNLLEKYKLPLNTTKNNI